MQLFCPACQSAFPGVSRCPRCGGLLLMPHEVSPDAPHRQTEAPPPVATTLAGRVLFGAALTLGAYMGLHSLVTGVVLMADSDATAWWLSFKGLAAVAAAQVVAVTFGAAVAAAGRAKGYTPGLVVGALCGAGFVVVAISSGASPTNLVLYLQPPLLALFGFVAGAAGTWVWPPPPHVRLPAAAGSKLSSIQLLEDEVARPEPPTRWPRIVLGAFVMIVGMAIADDFRKAAQKHSGGLLRVESLGQGEFITWQIGMFAVLFGGIIAGAETSAGLRHGVISGTIGAIGVYATCAKAGTVLPPVAWSLNRLSMSDLPLDSPAVIAAIGGIVLLTGVLGGCLGGVIFLKLAPLHMRHRSRGEA